MPIRCVLFVLCLHIAPFEAVGGQAARPRFLVTNDDGILAPGIVALVTELAAIGDVTVFAPSENRSGSSLAMGLGAAAVSVRPVTANGALFGYAVDAGPAGAALVGLEYEAQAGRTVDVVVSGINNGANIGDGAHFSGTVGAAMIGAYRGILSVAVSTDDQRPNFAVAARFTAKFVLELLARQPPRGVVYSINVPAVVSGTTAVAVPMAGSHYVLGLDVEISDSSGTAVQRLRPAVVPTGSDTESYLAGRVTITPLRFDWTAEEALRDLPAWNITIP